METSIQNIPLSQLAIAFAPAIVVIVLLYRWSLGGGNAIYALVRMLVQLLLIGYLLTFIFDTDKQWLVLTVLLVMVAVASWIALRTVSVERRNALYLSTLYASIIGGGIILALIILAVLRVEPWYQPNQLIPLAGMIFANSMNCISLAVERLNSEVERGIPYDKARNIAFNTAMIPIINSLFAVGLVSLPGMMTGQILSGVSPLIAVRYQIMVMCMVFGSAGITTALFLVFIKKHYPPDKV